MKLPEFPEVEIIKQYLTVAITDMTISRLVERVSSLRVPFEDELHSSLTVNNIIYKFRYAGVPARY
jgi:formamidopyrimidine-DNA glycosylase